MNKAVCFAYYADGKFLGWYGGTFGPVSKSPKVYSNYDEMKPRIEKNLTNKLKKINETTFNEASEKVSGLAALSLLVFDSEDELRGKDVELRAVVCPEYDGPNPDFDNVAHEAEVKAHSELWKFREAELQLKEGPSVERSKAVNEFLKEHPYPKYKGWVYCDYEKVREWAKNEPTEFFDVIKPTL